MSHGKNVPIDFNVYFSDHWSEAVYTLDELAERIAKDPGSASEYHLAGTNTSYAQYVADQSEAAGGNLIQRVTTVIANVESIQCLYDSVVGLCKRELGAQATALFVEDGDRKHLRAIAASGYARTLITNEATYEMGQGITGNVWETGQTVKCDSHREMLDHRWRMGKYDEQQWTEGTRCESLVFVALQYASSPFGVLKVENKRLGHEIFPFTSEDVAALELIASLIAYSVRRSILAERGPSGAGEESE